MQETYGCNHIRDLLGGGADLDFAVELRVHVVVNGQVARVSEACTKGGVVGLGS